MFFIQKQIIILGKSLSRKISIFNVIFNLLLQKCSFYLSFGQYFINLNPACCAKQLINRHVRVWRVWVWNDSIAKWGTGCFFAKALPILLTVVLAVPSVQSCQSSQRISFYTSDPLNRVYFSFSIMLLIYMSVNTIPFLFYSFSFSVQYSRIWAL